MVEMGVLRHKPYSKLDLSKKDSTKKHMLAFTMQLLETMMTLEA
jgi:hypothetical protein